MYFLFSKYRIKVHFIFDKRFDDGFNEQDGKSTDEHMEEVVTLVKNIFKDKSLKKELGTTINLIATKRKHEEDLFNLW